MYCGSGTVANDVTRARRASGGANVMTAILKVSRGRESRHIKNPTPSIHSMRINLKNTPAMFHLIRFQTTEHRPTLCHLEESESRPNKKMMSSDMGIMGSVADPNIAHFMILRYKTHV